MVLVPNVVTGLATGISVPVGLKLEIQWEVVSF
jgi:hypothetical protein